MIETRLTRAAARESAARTYRFRDTGYIGGARGDYYGPPFRNAFGYRWYIGDPWGMAHPDHNCYSAAAAVEVTREGSMWLGVKHIPRVFHGRIYPWAVGRVHSADLFKYGIFEFWFLAPLAPGLWPAIWLYDHDDWPPEIDVFEGWTQDGAAQKNDDPIFGSKAPHGYRKCLLNMIKPGLVYGSEGATENVSGGVLKRGTWFWHTDPQHKMYARLVWTPTEISVYYGRHRELHVTDRSVLRHYNECDGMILVLNNYVQDSFNPATFHEWPGFHHMWIYDFRYTPMGEEVAL